MKKLLLPLMLFSFSLFAHGQTVIDLTGNDSEWALNDTIASAEGPQEIILNPAVEYEIGSRRISNNTIIRSDPEGPRAVINISNNFWLGEVELDSLIFEHLHLKGGGYIFNNGNSYTVGKVAFVDCKIEGNGGLWRGKADTSMVENYIIDNCVIDSIGEYTLMRPQGSNGIGNISLTNSTVNYAKGLFRLSERPETVKIENVTIHQGCDADFWINAMLTFYGGFGELEFNNVLVGPGLNGSIGAIEVAEEDAGNITVTNSYYTTDFVANEGMELPAEFEAYAGASTDLWADPSAADFTIIDNNFDAKFSTGDPRWIPARLSELSLSAGELSPSFDPTVLSYTCELPEGTEAVVVTAVPGHEEATVSGDGVIDVTSGSGTANVVVLEGTISQTYTIEFTVIVGIDQNLEGKVELYYNSVNDEVVIKNLGTTNQLQKVEIFSLTGQVLKSYDIHNPSKRMTISTSDLGRGLYLLRGTYSNNASAYLKFLK